MAQTEFTITELAQEFGLTHRALRFYESRGLLAPQRDGRRRIFSRADATGCAHPQGQETRLHADRDQPDGRGAIRPRERSTR